jgi:hypothetical protein
VHTRQESLDGGSAWRKVSVYAQDNTNKRKQASMPRVRFEPTTPAFERAKTVHGFKWRGLCNQRKFITFDFNMIPLFMRRLEIHSWIKFFFCKITYTKFKCSEWTRSTSTRSRQLLFLRSRERPILPSFHATHYRTTGLPVLEYYVDNTRHQATIYFLPVYIL